MAKIFISYRRDDAAGHAGRLFDHLVREFGSDQIFMDRVDIGPGDDFAEVIAREATASDALLAVIGRRWLSAEDGQGRRRLDDPDDILRRELEAGLAQSGRTIPVLVDGAAMPARDVLPSSLTGLLQHNAHELSDSRWDYDFKGLLEVLGPIFGIPRQHSFEPRMLLIPAGTFLMGADPSVDPHADPIEQPQHEVRLPDFYISKLPITKAEFQTFLRENPYEAEQVRRDETIQAMFRRSKQEAGIADVEPSRPLGGVTVGTSRVSSYCAWLSRKTGRLYRPPNEAEWEKAVRGTDGRIYPWGNEWLTEAEQKEGERRRVGPHGLLETVGSPEWVWTEVRTVDVETERESLGERLRFWEVPTEERPVSNYPYDPRRLNDAAWKALVFGQRYVRRGGAAWSAEAARCTTRDFSFRTALRPASFRVVLSRSQVVLSRLGSVRGGAS